MKICLNKDDMKHMFKVLKPALSKDDHRPMLKLIQLKCRDNVVTAYSTDSHRMHSVKLSCAGESDDCQILIPVVDIPKNSALFVEIIDDGQFVAFNFGTEQIIVPSNQGLKYPQTEGVIPKGDPEYQIAFNPKYLKEVGDIFAKDGTIILSFYGKTNPCVVKPAAGDHTEDFCLVLPVRISNL